MNQGALARLMLAAWGTGSGVLGADVRLVFFTSPSFYGGTFDAPETREATRLAVSHVNAAGSGLLPNDNLVVEQACREWPSV